MLGVADKSDSSLKSTCAYTELQRTMGLFSGCCVQQKLWGLTACATFCALSLSVLRRKSNLAVLQTNNLSQLLLL